MSSELRIRLTNGELVLIAPSGQELRARSEAALGGLAKHLLEMQGQSLEHRIGSPASPTQRMVDDFIARGGLVKKIGQRKKIDVSLEELGL